MAAEGAAKGPPRMAAAAAVEAIVDGAETEPCPGVEPDALSPAADMPGRCPTIIMAGPIADGGARICGGCGCDCDCDCWCDGGGGGPVTADTWDGFTTCDGKGAVPPPGGSRTNEDAVAEPTTLAA